MIWSKQNPSITTFMWLNKISIYKFKLYNMAFISEKNSPITIIKAGFVVIIKYFIDVN